MAKAKTKPTRLKNGRFQIDVRDSHGERMRPSYPTRAEALAAIAQIEGQKAKGELLAGSRHHTFGQALDLLLEQKKLAGMLPSHLQRMRYVIECHLRPVFGARKLDEFHKQRAAFVQEHLNRRAAEDSAKPQTLAHELSYTRMALKEAITKGLGLSAPNPIDAYEIKVPQTHKTDPRDPLKLTEISALIRAATAPRAHGSPRDHGENELTWRSTFIEILLGLLVGFRNQECSGLFWDCVNFDSRIIHMRRIWRQGKGIVSSSKTGKQGQRNIPMSPILFVALRSHQERLRELNHKVEGEAPVLISRAKFVIPYAIGDHWNQITRKAGFDPDRHDFYALRHTFASILISIGLPIDRLKRLMGHSTILTTDSKYMHDVPEYDPLRREVDSIIQEFRLERTSEGYIDALGIALAHRWKDEGIEIGCAEPRSVTPQLGNNGSMKLLPGTDTTIDLVPISQSMAEPAPAPGPGIFSLQALREHQMRECHRLHALGWTKPRIGEKLGLCRSTISDWIRTAPDPRWMRKLNKADRAQKMQRCAQLRDEHPDWLAKDIARVLGVKTYLVVVWERRRGKAMPHRPGFHKLGKHDAAIRKMFGQGLSQKEMAKRLNGAVSKSAIWYYVKRIGLDWNSRPQRGGGVNLDLHETRIRELVAEGKRAWTISRELGVASASGIHAFIGRKGIRGPAESSQNSEETPAK